MSHQAVCSCCQEIRPLEREIKRLEERLAAATKQRAETLTKEQRLKLARQAQPEHMGLTSGDWIEGYAQALADVHMGRGTSTRALELWAMDVLNASSDWEVYPGPRQDNRGLSYCVARDVSHEGKTPAEAMVSAARALKAAHLELPDEPKGSE